jgi:hypothetical protein
MINGNEILELMCKPMYDEKVLNMMEKLEMKVPELDEKYQIEERVTINSSSKEILFAFKELDGYTKDGIPSLYKVEIIGKDYNITLPFNINYKDNYKKCCKVFGSEGEQLRANGKRWKIKYNDNPLLIVIRFDNEQLEGITFLQIFEDIKE